MTADEWAYKLARELEDEMRRMGVITTAHYSARTPDGKHLLAETIRVVAAEAVAPIREDGHVYGSRPCETCAAITALIGEPFGCDLYRSRREKRDR